ncbi:magnesium-dependent phosphatase 1-like [Tubulanus polymorphus]|uniref:magnesium-dependent phosphatase 1-like n=1 Tax=Tubulanus polymorphus TaxID=672921 RepID=UPI003DA4994D
MGTKKPDLIVFDLDYTLWPFWVDSHHSPPFRKESNGFVYDAYRSRVHYFPDVPRILEDLHEKGYTLGVASRTGAIEEAKSLMTLFDWNKYFTYQEIYPGSKVNHFKRFKEKSGLKYENMLFFDDEYRNIAEVSKLGVTCILADSGVDTQLLKKGFDEFSVTTKFK